jgi:hypothetical protein
MEIAEPLDQLRIAVAEVDVLATLTRAAYDSADWGEADPDIVERVAILLGLIEKSSASAMSAFHRLHGAVADAQPAPAEERWDYSDGTAPGRDAAAVQREVDAIAEMQRRG